jgi:hypothetical protein
MKKFFGILFFFSALFAGFAIPQYAPADSLCFNQSVPTPVPTSGAPTLGLCTGSGNSLNVNITGGTIPTGAPPTTYPTSATGVLLVQPTNVPTTGVTVVNTPGVVIQNTSIPVTPATTFPVSGTVTVNTPAPYPTAANGFLQVNIGGPTPVPVSIATALAIIPAQVNECNVGFSACSNVGTTVADGYSDLLESIFSTGFAYVYNGTSWDRQRDVQGVGNNTSGLGLDAVGGYLQYNTTLPTPSAGMYTAIQGDSNGRLIVSPTTLPTPVPYATAAGSTLSVNIAAQSLSPLVVSTPVPLATSASGLAKVVRCDPTTASSCASVSSSGVGADQICSSSAACVTVTTASNGIGSSNNFLLGLGAELGFNGTSFDLARTATVGNTIAPQGLMAAAPYCENLTTLPTLTTGTYGAAQCDTSGRLLISPTGLPTPLATQPVSGTVTANNGGCNNQGLSNTKVAMGTSGGTAGFYQIVGLVAGQTITVCSFSFSGYGTTTPGAILVGGTGTNCSSVITNNTGTIYLSASSASPSSYTFGTGLGPVTTPFTVANELCLDATGTAPTVTVTVVYEQH